MQKEGWWHVETGYQEIPKTISLCTIDRNLTEPGTKVTVVWGDRGGLQKEIRATVIKLPFKEDKRRIDVSRLWCAVTEAKGGDSLRGIMLKVPERPDGR